MVFPSSRYGFIKPPIRQLAQVHNSRLPQCIAKVSGFRMYIHFSSNICVVEIDSHSFIIKTTMIQALAVVLVNTNEILQSKRKPASAEADTLIFFT